MTKRWYVYFLIHRKEIVYVGMSCNIASRIAQHFIDKKFTSIRWTAYKSKVEAAKAEKRLILKFMPKYNGEYFLTLQRRKKGIIKGHLSETTMDLLQSIAVESEVSMEDLLKNPLVKNLYEYEKYDNPKFTKI